jgi:hypothetical protein
MNAIIASCKKYGVESTIIDKSRLDNTINKMFLKDDSIAKMIDLSFPRHPGKKLAIKFEIDTNPPLGSNLELQFLGFPLEHSIAAQDLSSSFAGKCHALLCRNYIKGRDWYDLAWYVTRKITPNFVFLQNALEQQGPWAHQKINATPTWLLETLQEKINTLDW